MQTSTPIYIVMEMACFVLIATLLRISSAEISIYQLTLLRYGSSFLLLLPFSFKLCPRMEITDVKRHAPRSLLIYISALAWTYAIHSIDVGLAQALLYTKTILLGALAGRLGSAAPSRVEWICITTGVAGVILAVSPSLNSAPVPGAAAALLSALTASVIASQTRLIGAFQAPIMATLITSALTCAFALPLAAISWRPLNLDEVILVCAIGLLTTISQALLFRVFPRSGLPRIAIIDLGRIILATLAGVIFFKNAVTPSYIVGILIISLSIFSAIRFS